MLRKQLFSAEEVQAIDEDYHDAGLEPAEVAMMDFAHKLTLHAHAVTQEAIDALRAYGLSDADILDVALVAAARNFFSKVLDAVGAEADAVYMELEEGLRKALTVGRPFGEVD